jgi:Vitamin K-dependent gamma-carboxylase
VSAETLDGAAPARPAVPLGQRLAFGRLIVARVLAGWYQTVLTKPFALYGAAALRIGSGLLFLAFMLHEIGDRHRFWGPHATWSPDLEKAWAQSSNWYGWIRSWYTMFAVGSNGVFELLYVLAIVVGLLMVAGVRTRLVSIAFMLFVTGFQGRNMNILDPSDEILLIVSFYLVFMRAGEHWSVDSWLRARRAAAGKPPRTLGAAGTGLAELGEARRRLVTLAHNCAVLGVAFQMCLIYGAAALWKVQGNTWQDGSALYYALRLGWSSPWPGLANWLGSHSFMVAAITYFTIFLQMGFPFVLFTKRLKYVFLVMLLGMHLGIAVLLGLPWFSAMMIVGDSVFLPEAFWRAVGRGVARLFRRPASSTVDTVPVERAPEPVAAPA